MMNQVQSPEKARTQNQMRGLDALRQGGLLSLRLLGYRERPSQIQMAATVVVTLSKRVHAVLGSTSERKDKALFLCNASEAGPGRSRRV